MNRILLAITLFLCTLAGLQAQSFRGTDKSPLDKAFFPDNFAHDRTPGDKAVIRVTYSRPSMNDRVVFGKLVPYGEVWRCGANESTEIKFYQDVALNGKAVKAGTYSLFAIPGEKEWTLILSSDLDYWGAYKYNEKNDVLRVAAAVSESAKAVENFTIQFDKKGNGGVMMLAWDKTVAAVPFTY